MYVRAMNWVSKIHTALMRDRNQCTGRRSEINKDEILRNIFQFRNDDHSEILCQEKQKYCKQTQGACQTY